MLKSFKIATLWEKHSAVYWAVSDGEPYTWLGVWPLTWVSQVSIPVILRFSGSTYLRPSHMFLEQELSDPASDRILAPRSTLSESTQASWFWLFEGFLTQPENPSHTVMAQRPQLVRVCAQQGLLLSPTLPPSRPAVRSCDPVKWAATSLSDNYKWHTCSPLSCSSES